MVVKEPNDTVSEEDYLKEARINKVASQKCENIVKFLFVSPSVEFAIMQENIGFNLSLFNDDIEVSSLQAFLKRLDTKYDCEGFEHLPLFIAKDISNGLHHLHNMGIAHRDLKPANILVSNQHFDGVTDEEKERLWQTEPIICKLADFGESRSDLIHTQAMLRTSAVRKSKVADFERGTPAYRSPELLVAQKRPNSMGHKDLVKVDVWAYGMTIFTILNPDQGFPYYFDIRNGTQRGEDAIDILISMLKHHKKPSVSKKYEERHGKVWMDLFNLYNNCTDFGMGRINNMAEIKDNVRIYIRLGPQR